MSFKQLSGGCRNRRFLFGAAIAAVVAVAAALAATSARADRGGKGDPGGQGSANAATHVTICHATGSPDTAGNGYVRISPSASGVYHGHYRQHDADIIPPFQYGGQTYSKNWDANGQAIWNNGCTAPAGTAAPAAPQPGLTLQKLERVGASGAFVAGPLTANVGDTVFYQIVAHDSGNTQLSVTLSDPRCDAGTLVPSTPVTLNPGDTELYTCSHLLVAGDAPTFVNTATATASSLNATASAVTASASATTTVAAAGSGVAGAQKTVTRSRAKTVTRKAAAPKRAAVKAASFTG